MRKAGQQLHTIIFDISAVVFICVTTYLLYYFAAIYQAMNSRHPLFVGFAVFSILSTFGEVLSQRVIGQGWRVHAVVPRAILWGVIGIWISLVFPFMASGTAALVASGLWPDLNLPLSISLWANILSGFAFSMMMVHFWISNIIERGWIAPWAIFHDSAFPSFAKTVLISLVLFWIPAHFVTFSLPPLLRSIFAAYLGIALGFILALAQLKATNGSRRGRSHAGVVVN